MCLNLGNDDAYWEAIGGTWHMPTGTILILSFRERPIGRGEALIDVSTSGTWRCLLRIDRWHLAQCFVLAFSRIAPKRLVCSEWERHRWRIVWKCGCWSTHFAVVHPQKLMKHPWPTSDTVLVVRHGCSIHFCGCNTAKWVLRHPHFHTILHLWGEALIDVLRPREHDSACWESICGTLHMPSLQICEICISTILASRQCLAMPVSSKIKFLRRNAELSKACAAERGQSGKRGRELDELFRAAKILPREGAGTWGNQNPTLIRVLGPGAAQSLPQMWYLKTHVYCVLYSMAALLQHHIFSSLSTSFLVSFKIKTTKEWRQEAKNWYNQKQQKTTTYLQCHFLSISTLPFLYFDIISFISFNIIFCPFNAFLPFLSPLLCQ